MRRVCREPVVPVVPVEPVVGWRAAHLMVLRPLVFSTMAAEGTTKSATHDTPATHTSDVMHRHQ
jgi:hypothetical protein